MREVIKKIPVDPKTGKSINKLHFTQTIPFPSNNLMIESRFTPILHPVILHNLLFEWSATVERSEGSISWLLGKVLYYFSMSHEHVQILKSFNHRVWSFVFLPLFVFFKWCINCQFLSFWGISFGKLHWSFRPCIRFHIEVTIHILILYWWFLFLI